MTIFKPALALLVALSAAPVDAEIRATSGTFTGNGSGITAINGGNITTGTVTASQIAAGTITASQIAAGTIIGNLIAANTIAAGNIVAGTITASQIAAGTITAGNISAGTITTSQLNFSPVLTGGAAGDVNANGTTISGTKITASSITTSQIAANTITADNMNVGTLSAISVNLGTVTAGSLDVGSTNHLWANTDATWYFGVGGTAVATAPFRIRNDGTAIVSVASIDSLLVGSNFNVTGSFSVQTNALFAAGMNFSAAAGGGNRALCVDNGGTVYTGSPGC